MIHIVNYGLGNVRAFLNLYERLGIEACLASSADELSNATRVILPGVGAFDHAITLLDASGMRPVLEDLALNKNVPVLGICVGMQILANISEEGDLAGLEWIPGQVKSFKSYPESTVLPLPHMGWNDVLPTRQSQLFKGLEDKARFYFLHSYLFECSADQNSLATAYYGHNFSCAVNSGNIYGVQFHPEKSHHWGMKLLQNFAEIDNS